MAKARKASRLHFAAPPRGAAVDQTTGFHTLLVTLYKLEDEMEPKLPATRRAFAEARAVCERFLPVPLSTMLRNKYR